MKFINNPTRCRIVDVEGQVINPDFPYLVARTPKASKPHVGKRGTAELQSDGNVKITLDDGEVIYGYECWWIPIDDEKSD